MRREDGAELQARRLERLKEELLDDARIGSLGDVELEEIAYCIYPPVHEGRQPPYGAIVSERTGAFPNGQTISTTTRVAKLRRYADGYSTFVHRGPHRPELLLLPSVGYSESELVRLSTTASATVVRRSVNGQISLVVPGRVAWRSGGAWAWKPSVASYTEAVGDHVPDRSVRRDVVEPLLELCVHGLSPLGIGATLVLSMRPRGLHNIAPEHLDETHAIASLALNVGNHGHHPAITAALAQLDRAVLVEETGQVESMGVTLLPSGTPAEKTDRGTRHASAAAFSAAYSSLLVVVVSSNGPVTVYKHGRRIASTSSARRLDEDVELCQCVEDQPDFDPDDDDLWSDVAGMADPHCPYCGGFGIQQFVVEFEEPFDNIL